MHVSATLPHVASPKKPHDPIIFKKLVGRQLSVDEIMMSSDESCDMGDMELKSAIAIPRAISFIICSVSSVCNIQHPKSPVFSLHLQYFRMLMDTRNQTHPHSPPDSFRNLPLIDSPQPSFSPMSYPSHRSHIFRHHRKVLSEKSASASLLSIQLENTRSPKIPQNPANEV